MINITKIIKSFTLVAILVLCNACDSSTVVSVTEQQKTISVELPCTPRITRKEIKDEELAVTTRIHSCEDSLHSYLFFYAKYPKNTFNDSDNTEFLEAKAKFIAHAGYPNKMLSKNKTEIQGHQVYIIRKRLFSPSSIIESRIFIVGDGFFQVMYGAAKDKFSNETGRFFLKSIQINEDVG